MKHEEGPEDEESESVGITYSGGDGSAPGEAIVIEGARSHVEGIRAEKRYLARRFGKRVIRLASSEPIPSRRRRAGHR